MSNLFEKWNKEGVNLPFARDAADNGKPSVTLLLMYFANLVAILSLIYLHIKADAFVATSTTCMYAITCTILYMFRKLSKAKFNLKDKDFELDGASDDKTT